MAGKPFPTVSRQLRHYSQDLADEPWKRAHRTAMACRDFEGFIETGTRLFAFLIRLDEKWREDVYAGHEPWAKEVEEQLLSLIKKWHETSRAAARTLGEFEKKGFAVEGAREFRSCVAEARGILTKDEEFFSGEALSRLREKAAKEEESGKLSDLRRLLDRK